MLENVKVSDRMTSPVITVSPLTLISHAHQKMKEYGIRRLPVMEGGKLVGIVTLGDIREASPSDATSLSIWELNYLWSQLTVEKVMTRKVWTVKPDNSIVDAAEIMLHRRVSGLPVVDDEMHVVGVITESDIFRLLVESRKPAVASE
ncbi:CBS domain-containing protein [Anaerolineae bacterium CFX9]|jgi:CBS domain-containing protein|nr:CBS domain-containing protein [Anaerolineae bacterium CFX9]